MSWSKARLDTVADLCLGKMLDKKKNKGSLLPYLANINVRWGTLDLQDLREMRFEERELERYGLQSGDIVMCEGGEPGRCVLWRDQIPGMMIQKALHRIRPHKGVDNEFLFYSLFHMGRSGQLERHFTGATIKHLPGERLARVEVALPPLETQRRIAAILGAYDDLIEVNRRRVAVLEEMARGLFEEWFVRFRFPGHEDVPIVNTPDGPLPDGWEWGAVSDIAEKTGTTHNPSKTPDETFAHYSLPAFDAGRAPALDRGEDIKSNKTLFSGPVVLVSKLNPRIPRVWHVPSDHPQRQLASTEFVPLAPSDAFSSSLLWVLVSDASFRDRLIGMAGGTSTSHQRVKPKDILATPIPLAPHRIIAQANEYIDPLIQLSLNLEAANRELASARDLLLPRLISGQLSVEAAERELEDAA